MYFVALALTTSPISTEIYSNLYMVLGTLDTNHDIINITYGFLQGTLFCILYIKPTDYVFTNQFTVGQLKNYLHNTR